MMRILRSSWHRVLPAALLLASSAVLISPWVAGRLTASQNDANQSARVPARITRAINEADRTTLRGNVHPLARTEFDRGQVSPSQPMTRMMLLLERSAEQEATLRQLLDDQQNPASPNFHKWLTPEQFGQQFGPADADIEAIRAWLASAGFENVKVSTGRTVMEFSGNVAQVSRAFHTDVHRFIAHGEEHFANTTDPQIPAALGPVVRGIVSLHNFRPQPMMQRLGTFERKANGEIVPLFTYTNALGNTFYALGPTDFATIYKVPNSSTDTLCGGAPCDGSGQSIAVVGRSNINRQDVTDFRAMFGLPAYAPNQFQVILNGPDPGLVPGDEGESDLDVQWAGAVAPQATILFVTTQSTITDSVDGVEASELYIVDNNLAPVMSVSYGLCETALGNGGNSFYNALWQQAAAEGITVVVSAGDSGSAGCDDPTTQTAATRGLAVSGIASTPFNVAIGGTDFDDVANPLLFWNPVNTPVTQASANSYIPESTWNDSCAATATPTSGNTCPTVNSNGIDLVAGSGGPSNCATKDLSGHCTGGYAKPSWQTGFGDANRDIPDISLFAGAGKNRHFYIICQADQNNPGVNGCTLTVTPRHFLGVGGTSAGAPTFAAIMALVNQKTGQRQGNANYALYNTYSIANGAGRVCNSTTQFPANPACVFYDITKGNNSVACQGGKPNCSNSNAATGQFGYMATLAGGSTPAFVTSAGYDLATGLGTINVTNLLSQWAVPSRTATTTTLFPSTAFPIQVGAVANFNGSVTGSGGTPTGIVVLESPTGAAIDRATLSAGNYTLSTTFLPGGSYNVMAHYGGDGTFAPSDSTAVPVTVNKQNSSTRVFFVTSTLSSGPVTVPYGSPYILRIDVLNAAATTPDPRCVNLNTGVAQYVCPTGTVTLTSNGSPLNDFPNAQTPNATNVATLNDRGFAEDQPIQLSPGNYSIVAAYSGDNSYNAGTSPPLSATITKATTSTAVTSNVTTVVRGGSVTLTAKVATTSNGAGPTGTVQFKNGSANLSTPATCMPMAAIQTTAASCTATLTTTLSALPGPFGDSGPKTRLPLILLLSACAFVLLVYALFFVRSATWRRCAYAGLLLLVLAAAGIAGCSGAQNTGGGGGGPGPRSLTGVYSGDANYAGSTSLPTVVTVQ